jgi:PTH1 family peptidyl-tRNA hydrolase
MNITSIPNVIIGLGNPESKYNLTRHNLGFEVLDKLNTKNEKWNEGEHGLWCLNWHHNAIMVKPTTGMNRSGLGVKDAFEAIDKDISHIIVIHDDMDFEPGDIKIKVGGGSGRHNGLQSVIDNIGPDFIRIRIGIGKPPSKEESINFVLGKFSSYERKFINGAILGAAEAVSWIIQDGIDKAMNEFNQMRRFCSDE